MMSQKSKKKVLTNGILPGAGDASYIWTRSSWGSLSNVWSMRNMSRVSSENLTWSEQEPTISTSCKVRVIMGDFSTGGVIKGFSLKIDMRTTVTKVASEAERWGRTFSSAKILTKFLFTSTVAPLSTTNKTRESSNLIKILAEQNVRPHLSNSDATLIYFRTRKERLGRFC